MVVPVYRGAEALGPLTERLQAVLTSCCDRFELILVDDCSPDASWEVIKQIVSERPWVHGIRLMRNSGQHSALLCGVREARFPVVATLDDDLQHPPEALPALLEVLENGHDVVYGTPATEQHGLWRDLASRLTKLALRTTMGASTAQKVSAFRVFRTDLRKAFTSYQGSFVSLDVLLTWGTTRFGSVSVRHEPRAQGKSNYTFRMLVTHAVNMITGFSTIPLQLASVVGFAMTVFGGFVLLFVLGRYLLQGDSVPGFPFLASVIAIFSGAQLLSLGIIGEYLARMHFRLMDKPAYTLGERAAGPGVSSQ